MASLKHVGLHPIQGLNVRSAAADFATLGFFQTVVPLSVLRCLFNDTKSAFCTNLKNFAGVGEFCLRLIKLIAASDF